MKNFYMLIGVPGSGKSTWAKIHKEEFDYEIVSSDDIRYELYGTEENQSNPTEVFRIAHQRCIDYLNNGKNVCYDCTNTTIKNRKSIFQILKSINDVNVIGIVFNTPQLVCHNNNTNRQRKVPSFVIDRFINSYEIPFYAEGFNELRLANCFEFDKLSIFDALDQMRGFDQNNPHHSLTLDKHCEACEDYVLEKNNEFDVTPELACAALLHDYGKLFAVVKDPSKGYNHYYNHENIGAYKILTEIDIPDYLDIFTVVFYVNYHMLPHRMNAMSAKTVNKYLSLFEIDYFKWQSLQILHEADEKAH